MKKIYICSAVLALASEIGPVLAKTNEYPIVTVSRADGTIERERRKNLVTNVDHRLDNGIGMPCSWYKHVRYPLEATLDVEPIPGENGFRVRTGGRPFILYEQRGIRLVPGAKYLLSYDVRTYGNCGNQHCILIHDRSWKWKAQQMSPYFPVDTKGEWKHVEKVLSAPKNDNPGEHTLAICCSEGYSNEKAANSVFELRNISLVAVDADVDEKSEPPNCEPLVARIVPVDPLLSNVNTEDGRMRFFCASRPACGITNCLLAAKADGLKDVTAAFDEDGYATVHFGKSGPKTRRVQVKVLDAARQVIATNEYRTEFRRPVPVVTVGRRLNNLVTELVNAPLENGDVEFSRAKDGWVWISFEGEVGDAEGYLDDIGGPVVRRRAFERRLETQRWVSAGVHRLRVAGARSGGRLRINAVKTIMGSPIRTLGGKSLTVRGRFDYGLPFTGRFEIHSTLNTTTRNHSLGMCRNLDTIGYCVERGMRFWVQDRIASNDSRREDFVWLRDRLTSQSWRTGLPMIVDENNVHTKPRASVNYSEAVWGLFAERPETPVNLFYADTYRGYWYDQPATHVSEIASTINTGSGTGLLVPEIYSPVLATRDDLQVYIDRTARFLKSAVELVPAAKESVVGYLASYVVIGDWSNYVCPDTDIKAHFCALLHSFATDSRFEGLAGVGFGGIFRGDEEFRRWGARCLRHYALEGRTEDLAAEYGFPWTPGFVRNSEFVDGLKDWSVDGNVVAEKIDDYGIRIQRRRGASQGYGDTVATFRSSSAHANAIRQRIDGLVPGMFYAVGCCVATKATISAGSKAGFECADPFAFSIRLEGAKDIETLRFENFTYPAARKAGATVSLHNLRYVFRAESDTAELVFTDRNDDGEKTLTEGVEQSLNYIRFYPYYAESAEEVQEIAASLGWTDGNRIRK